jgi:hypothetical protein
MNKRTLLLIILCFLAFEKTSFAQFGVRTGLTSSNFTQYDFNARLGLHLGAYYNYSINDKFSVEPGLFYSQKGYTFKTPKINENINYIDIPVLVRYHVNEKFNVFAGPQASAPISRKYVRGNDAVNTSLQSIRGYDGAAVIGLGHQMPSGLNFQVSYEMGLVNLNYFNNNVKNQALKFSIGKNF